MSKATRYTFEAEAGVRDIMAELKRMNSGRAKRAFSRHRAYYFTAGYAPLKEGSSEVMLLAAREAAQQFGGRLVRFAATLHNIEIDFFLPPEVSLAKASKLLKRHTSRAYISRFRGYGNPGSNGYIWKPSEIIETLSPISGISVGERYRIRHAEEAIEDES